MWRMRFAALVLILIASAGAAGAQEYDDSDVPYSEAGVAQIEDGAPKRRAGAPHAVPLYGTLIRGFDAPPDDPYAAGHRGLDVAAPEGTAVYSSAPGTITYDGWVAGNQTVTIEHGNRIRTTYSYMADMAFHYGAYVTRGRIIGHVGKGHPDSGLPPHVHLSARYDDTYFDPTWLYVGDYSDLLSIVR